MASASLDLAVRAAVEQGLLAPPKTIEDKPVALFYDLNLWEANLRALRDAFPEHWLHALALKTNPLAAMLRIARDLGFGAECASVGEAVHALNQSFANERVVFDSPCKTRPEIEFALRNQVHLNIDNMEELQRVSELLKSDEELLKSFQDSKGLIGVRINPLVGAGTIAAFSVSTGKSKFGIPVRPDARADLVAQLVACEWVSCIHVHTGSGGMGLSQLVSGVRVAVDLAIDINRAAGRPAIQVLDIGGGLSVNYASDEMCPSFQEYSEALRKEVPEIFQTPSAGGFRVVTEFGAASHVKFGWLASRVEYVKRSDQGQVVLIHAGSELFLRACYQKDSLAQHRVRVFDREGRPRLGEVEVQDVGGPLCFAGDVVAKDVEAPRIYGEDVVVLLDSGGNTLSLKTMHCSRQRPAVYGFRVEGTAVHFELLKEAQTISDTLAMW